MDDTHSQIESCLKCKKKECDNCIELQPKKKGTKPEIMYDWNGRKYSVNQLCEISGRSKSGLLYRIQIGGVDFAMSTFRKVEYYQKEKEPEKL